MKFVLEFHVEFIGIAESEFRVKLILKLNVEFIAEFGVKFVLEFHAFINEFCVKLVLKFNVEFIAVFHDVLYE